MTADCLVCRNNAAAELPPRERVVQTPHWRASHAFDTALPGWLVLTAARHVTALDELTAEESAELGPLLRELTAALREVVGSVKTYVMLFAEADGFEHLHVHLVPRMPDQLEELRGPRIFALLDLPPPQSMSPDAMDDVSIAVRTVMNARRSAQPRSGGVVESDGGAVVDDVELSGG